MAPGFSNKDIFGKPYELNFSVRMEVEASKQSLRGGYRSLGLEYSLRNSGLKQVLWPSRPSQCYFW